MKSIYLMLAALSIVLPGYAEAEQCIRTTSGGFGLKSDEICGGSTVTLPDGLGRDEREVLTRANDACQARLKERTADRFKDCGRLISEAYSRTKVPQVFLMLAKQLHRWEAYQKAYDAYHQYCTAVRDQNLPVPGCCQAEKLRKLREWLKYNQFFKVKLVVVPAGVRMLPVRKSKKKARPLKLSPAGYYCVPYDTRSLRLEHEGFLPETVAMHNDWGKMVEFAGEVVLKRPAVEIAVRSNVPHTAIYDPHQKSPLGVTPENIDAFARFKISHRGESATVKLRAEARGYPAKVFEINTKGDDPHFDVQITSPPSAVLDVSSREPDTRFYLRSEAIELPAAGSRRVVVGSQKYTLVANRKGDRPVEVGLDAQSLSGDPYPVDLDPPSSVGLFADIYLGISLRDYGDNRLATTPGTEFGLRLGYFVKRWQRTAIFITLASAISPVLDQSTDQADWYYLISLLGGGGLRVRLAHRAWFDVGLSLGTLMVASLDLATGALVSHGDASEVGPGTLFLLALRPSLTFGYEIWRGLSVGFMIEGEFSPDVASVLPDEISTITQLSLGGRIGWSF